MKKSLWVSVATLGFTLMSWDSTALAQDLSGTWCVKDDSQECVVLIVQGDGLRGEFRHGGAKTVDLVGYQTAGTVAMSFRNAKGEIGSWMTVASGTGQMNAICLNPDGSVRWKVTYVKQ